MFIKSNLNPLGKYIALPALYIYIRSKGDNPKFCI